MGHTGLTSPSLDSTGIRFGASRSARDLGLVGYAMLFSPDLRSALRRLARYSPIVSETFQFDLEEGPERTVLVLKSRPAFEVLQHPIEARLACIVAIAREITGTDLAPATVHFSCRKPREVAEHEWFFRAPLRFGAGAAALEFHGSDLERPLPAADETLVGYLDELARDHHRVLAPSGSFTDRIRRTLRTELSRQQLTLRGIASRLGFGVRTLQRRLKEEGTTFGAVLDSFRRDQSIRLLRDRSLAVYEVAFLLGYSEPSSFYRAFRRWTRVSPEAFRRAEAAGGCVLAHRK